MVLCACVVVLLFVQRGGSSPSAIPFASSFILLGLSLSIALGFAATALVGVGCYLGAFLLMEILGRPKGVIAAR